MKFFRKWLLGSLRRASSEESQQSETISDYAEELPMTYGNKTSGAKIRRLTITGSDIDLPEGGLNIQVKSAIGGKIVIFRNYDERTDRHTYSTYLIPDTEVFQESLGKIITMESLKL